MIESQRIEVKKRAVKTRRGRPTLQNAAVQKQALLARALEMFSSRGYRATSLDDLASSLGVSKSTIYRQHGSKVGLLNAVMEESAPVLATALANVRADNRRGIRLVLLDFARIINDYNHAAEVRTMWRAAVEASDELGDSSALVFRLRDAALQPLADYLQKMFDRGAIDISDVKTAAGCFSNMVGGLSTFLSNTETDDRRAAEAFAVTLFLNGILSPSDPSRPGKPGRAGKPSLS